MAVTTITGTSADAFTNILTLDGTGNGTEVRLLGSLKNTGSASLSIQVDLTNARAEEQSIVASLDPGNAIDIEPSKFNLAIGGPFLLVNVAVASASAGQSSTYDIRYTTW